MTSITLPTDFGSKLVTESTYDKINIIREGLFSVSYEPVLSAPIFRDVKGFQGAFIPILLLKSVNTLTIGEARICFVK